MQDDILMKLTRMILDDTWIILDDMRIILR